MKISSLLLDKYIIINSEALRQLAFKEQIDLFRILMNIPQAGLNDLKQNLVNLEGVLSDLFYIEHEQSEYTDGIIEDMFTNLFSVIINLTLLTQSPQDIEVHKHLIDIVNESTPAAYNILNKTYTAYVKIIMSI